MAMLEDSDTRFMRMALAEASDAAAEGEVPVGAVVACGKRLLARTHNLTQRLGDVTAHAEMLAITAACEALGGKYLNDCTLYVTVEPCIMCAGAIGWAQVGRLVYAAGDEKRGYRKFGNEDTLSPLHPKTKVEQGLLADEASQLMKDFFKKRR